MLHISFTTIREKTTIIPPSTSTAQHQSKINKAAMRVAYLALFFLNAATASLLREFGKTVLARFSAVFGFFSECDSVGGDGYCVGNQLVYRISFSLCCFFLIMSVFSCALVRGWENCCCLFAFQLPLYMAMLFGSLFLPNTFFDGYADVARIASAAFIILQIIIIVDSLYNLRDYILDKMEQADQDDDARQALLETAYETVPDASTAKSFWEAVYLSLVVCFIVLSMTGVIYMFKHYAGCDLNVTFISLTVVACLLVTVLSVTSWVNVGLLPSSAASLYLVYLCYQAIHSNPDDTCTLLDMADTPDHHGRSVLANAALAAFTITWTSWRTSATNTHLFTLSPSATLANEIDEDEDEQTTLFQQQKATVVPEYQFHVLMVLAAFYMAMVLTNWGSSDGLPSEADDSAAMWVKISSQWAAIMLFLWTLVAPTVLPDREFGGL